MPIRKDNHARDYMILVYGSIWHHTVPMNPKEQHVVSLYNVSMYSQEVCVINGI